MQKPKATANVFDAQKSLEPPQIDSAMRLLSQGFDALQGGYPTTAKAAFKAALATQELNDAGRILCFWHIYVADQAQGDLNAQKDALLDFISQSQLSLGHRGRQQRLDPIFVHRFDLTGRIARARAVLNLAWAEHIQSFGRSQTSPIIVYSKEEMDYFLALAPPCAAKPSRHIVKAPFDATGERHIAKVSLVCAGDTAPVNEQVHTYFFELNNPSVHQ